MSEADLPVRPDAATRGTLSFAETVRARRSVRRFRPDPVPEALLRTMLEEAQCSPSNCNTQPWQVHIVSGAARDRLSAAMAADWDAQRVTPDFSFDLHAYQGLCDERRKAQGAAYLEAMGVARDDPAGRDALTRGNLSFFGAPHVAFLFMPVVGDNVRTASDVGMYGQTLLLSLVAHGLGGIPQTMLGFFADTVRRELGLPDELKLLFGISFGYPDEDAPGSRHRVPRAPLGENVAFHA